MNGTPVCSVCIANYNGEDMLADCIDSILGQQSRPDTEIIVHDDASSDGSLQLLAEYPDVRVIASDDNVGFCVANNRMASAARGEYILLLNNDAALYPDALQTLLQHAMRNPGCGILTLPQYDWESGALVNRGCLLDPFYNPVPNLDRKRQDVAMAIGACLWLRKSLWQEIGGFPAWMVSLAEDMYLCCEARRRGLAVQVTPASGFRHRQGHSFGGSKPVAGRLQSTYRRRAMSEFNKTAVMLLCTPWPWLVVLFPLHVIALVTEGLVFSLVRLKPSIFGRIYASTLVRLWHKRALLRSLRARQSAHWSGSTRGYFSAFTWMPQKLVLLRRHGMPGLR